MIRPKNLRGKRITTTQREVRFANEYIVDFNGTQAAIRAGIPKRSASSQAQQLLSKTTVQDIVKAAVAARAERTAIDADWVLYELKDLFIKIRMINEADISEIYNEDGTMKPLHDWPPIWRQRQLIRSLEVSEIYDKDSKNGKRLIGYLKKLVQVDLVALQVRVLELIGRHAGVGAFGREEALGPGGSAPVTLNVIYVEPPPRRTIEEEVEVEV